MSREPRPNTPLARRVWLRCLRKRPSWAAIYHASRKHDREPEKLAPEFAPYMSVGWRNAIHHL